MSRVPAGTLVLASILFFASGALGLGYELVWIRQAALVVGASQIALSTVLTAFFLGLALGAWVAGRYLRSRGRSSLWMYGAFELGIGAFALAFPFLFSLLREAYGAAYPWFEGSSAGLFALRFVLLFALFVPPTFLMGGTLPLLLEGLAAAEPRAVGSRASFLYGLNIAGAVFGVLATSYFAIPWLGMTGTSVAGGIANLALGASAIAAFRGRPAEPRTEAAPGLGGALCAMAFASGLIALGYQVAWARYFSLIQFGTVYVTAILLASYLAALAAGSLVAAPLLRSRLHPLRLVGFAQCLAPIAAVLCLDAWRLADYRIAIERERLDAATSRPSITLEIAHDAPRFFSLVNETADATFFAPLFQVLLVLFLPVALLGIALPALVAAGTRSREELRAASGRLFFWNTLGASAGSFLAGYAVLPAFGLHGTLAALAAGAALLSAAAFLRARASEGAPFSWRALALPAAGAIAASLLLASRGDVTRATIRRQQFPADNPGARLVGIVEGPLTTAWVFDDDERIRIGSGAVQMGNVAKGAVNLQAIEGHLPALLYPGAGTPRDCLGICLGSGQSFGALLRYPIRRLDVVEISGEITELASGLLGEYNHHLARDPRVAFHLDDGRHFVARTPTASYDVVSMESPPPIHEGAHALYTEEFYREVRRVLRPDGVFMQFMPLYYLSPLDTRCVLRTLADSFAAVLVVKVSPGDFMLLAYPSTPRIARSALRERARVLESEWTSRGLPPGRWTPESAFPIASPEGILSTIVSGPDEARRTVAPYVLRDDRPLLSYGTGDRFLTRRYMGPALTFLSFAALKRTGFDRLSSLVDPPLTPEEVDALTSERVAALRVFRVADPRDLERKTLALEIAGSPVERADRALDLARTFDAELDKEGAFRYVEGALEALSRDPSLSRPAQLETVRAIVRNRVAVYHEVCARWIARFERSHPGAPLVAAMRAELDSFRSREAERARDYLVP